MDPLLQALVYVIIVAVAACGLYFLCIKFKMPDPVFWLVGAILILFVLAILLDKTGLYHFHG
jgi:predicted membrane-bound dolichyl-phosphate-mannose-protein mannosyltransferase